MASLLGGRLPVSVSSDGRCCAGCGCDGACCDCDSVCDCVCVSGWGGDSGGVDRPGGSTTTVIYTEVPWTFTSVPADGATRPGAAPSTPRSCGRPTCCPTTPGACAPWR